MHIRFYEGKVIGFFGNEAIPLLTLACDGKTVGRTDTQLCQDRKHTVDMHDEISVKVVDMAESINDFFKVVTETGIEGFCMRKYIALKK
mgnify:CR=1 FL=1